MTRDKLIKKIATWIMMAIMLSVFSLDIICVAMCNRYQNKFEITPAQFSSDGTADRIHFLNTYNSDAILIESNGKFALIDPARATAIRAGSSATTAAKRLL